MSKNHLEKEVDFNTLDQDELTALAEGETSEVPAAKKRVFSRILALVLAVAPVALLCFLPVNLFLIGESGYAFSDKITLLDVFLNLFKKNGVEKIYELAKVTTYADLSTFKYHGIPLLNTLETYGQVFSWYLYAFPVVFLLNIVFMFIGVFSGKKAPAMVRTIAFFDAMLFGGYALLIYMYSTSFATKAIYDIVVLSVAGAGTLFYIVYAFVTNGKKAIVPFILYLFTLAFIGAYGYAYIHYDMAANVRTLFSDTTKLFGKHTWGWFYDWSVRCGVGIFLLAAFFSTIRLFTKKGYAFDIFRYIVNLIGAAIIVCLCFIDMPFTKTVNEAKCLGVAKWFGVAAAGIALVQLLVCIIAKARIKAAEEEALYEEEEESDTSETQTAQVAPQPVMAQPIAAQAQPQPLYILPVAQQPVVAWQAPQPVQQPAPQPVVEEQAIEEEEQLVIPNFSSFAEEETKELEVAPAPAAVPVAPVAEEQTPAPAAQTAPAGYDYYNSKSFDPFIASLTDKEREQFTNLFILKYEGTMKYIPDYVVGGDNDEFFRKIFIFLGQYRDRIPDGLLAKMYKYCIKK